MWIETLAHSEVALVDVDADYEVLIQIAADSPRRAILIVSRWNSPVSGQAEGGKGRGAVGREWWKTRGAFNPYR